MISAIFSRKTAAGLALATVVALLGSSLFLAGCNEDPDTSAPERTVIDRTADWQGSLLYVADDNGPTEGWGSVRIYDNVSGFVEKTVEQSVAAAPTDMVVTDEESSMYVASGANGRVERFRWDGNNWRSAGVTIDTPAVSLLSLDQGPDGKLYGADAAPADGTAQLIVIDPLADKETGGITFPGYRAAHGAAWSADGLQLFVPATGPQGSSLLFCGWPAGNVTQAVALPAPVNQAVTSPDGRFVYVMGRGGVFQVDTATRAVAMTLNPDNNPQTDYYGGAFSADGRFLFVTATPPGSDSTLYVIDTTAGSTVSSVRHISVRANGIKRVE